MYLHNNTAETQKYFDKKKYDWDFAVPRQGYYDYSLRVTRSTDLKKNIQWMFFKAKVKKVFEIINSIDFAKLAQKNTTTPGFGKADVVEEYNNLMNKYAN
jgi:hypothetical protein